MMDLITDPKDERLMPVAYDNGYEGMRMAIIDMGVLRASLIAALSRAEKAEAALCRAREEAEDSLTDGYLSAKGLLKTLDSTAHCRHEEEIVRLREAIEWACSDGPQKYVFWHESWPTFVAELRRRAGIVKCQSSVHGHSEGTQDAGK